MLRRTLPVLLATLALVCGCTDSQQPSTARPPALVVASFDFAESALLAEIYAQALEHAGVPVRRELRLGSRELVLPALRQGLVDVVPEYLGSALATVSPTGPEPTDRAAAHARLAAALRADRLEVLTPAAAQNQNGLAVTRPTAERLRVRTTSGLIPHARRLTLTGPTECPRRPFCLQGLAKAYGLSFASFVPYDDEADRLTALEQGVVDVAVVFTTDGRLAAGDLVLLADDRHLQPAENVVPIVSDRGLQRYGARVRTALDAVSARLDTTSLAFLNWRVDVAGSTPRAEAHGWLVRHGLLPR